MRTPLVQLASIRLLLLFITLTTGCALVARGDRWDDVRRRTIEPINSTFHRHLPRDLKARDLDALVGLYAADQVEDLDWEGGDRFGGESFEQSLRWRDRETETPVRAHYARILDLFPTIEKAELRILRVYWETPEPEGVRADVRLLVRGGDGARRGQLDQRMDLWFAERAGSWKITREEVHARELVTSAAPFFELATEAAGIDDVHDTTGSPPFRIVGGSFNSSGSAVGDLDGDGDEDIVLVSASRLRVYRNRGNGRFEDATAASGLAAAFPGVATGALLFDYDNDGRSDLWVCSIGPSDRLYHNEGGHFRDVTERAGIKPGRWASMALAADYDRDGDLDVFVTRMGDQAETAPSPNYAAENGLPDTLYRNDGDGTFTDVSDRAGVADRGWGLASAWGDYDNDGWPDLYVGNEFGKNELYRNQRDGTFRKVGKPSGTDDRGAAMGVAWGDVDGDGDLDLFVSNMFANSSWLTLPPGLSAPGAVVSELLHRAHPADHGGDHARQLALPERRRRHVHRRERRGRRARRPVGLGRGVPRLRQRRPPRHLRQQRVRLRSCPRRRLNRHVRGRRSAPGSDRRQDARHRREQSQRLRARLSLPQQRRRDLHRRRLRERRRPHRGRTQRLDLRLRPRRLHGRPATQLSPAGATAAQPRRRRSLAAGEAGGHAQQPRRGRRARRRPHRWHAARSAR